MKKENSAEEARSSSQNIEEVCMDAQNDIQRLRKTCQVSFNSLVEVASTINDLKSALVPSK